MRGELPDLMMLGRGGDLQLDVPAAVHLHVPAVPPAVDPNTPAGGGDLLFDLIQQREAALRACSST